MIRLIVYDTGTVVYYSTQPNIQNAMIVLLIKHVKQEYNFVDKNNVCNRSKHTDNNAKTHA